MKQLEPTYRKPLHKKQIQLLTLLIKFRFVTTDLLVPIVHKDRSTIYERLHTLEQQGYIYKAYKPTYRQLGKPATYCIAAKGITFLKHLGMYPPNSLQLYYKNKSLILDSQNIVDSFLFAFTCHNILRSQLGDTYDLLTKYEYKNEELKPLPALYIHSKRSRKPHYFVDILPDPQTDWALYRRIDQYESAADAEEDTLIFLIITANVRTTKKLSKMLINYFCDALCYVTDKESFLTSPKEDIWVDIANSYDDEYTYTPLPTSAKKQI